MLKIWGRATSSSVQKAMFAIGELGLAYERVDIGYKFGGNREPAYLAKNPNGLVPTLEEDGFLLWESNSIVRHLAALHGRGTLEPSDPKARAVASQWMDWQLSIVQPAMFPAWWGLFRTSEAERDQKAVDASLQKTSDAMAIIDNALEKRPYLAGDTFSMGDIPLGVMVFRFFKIHPAPPALPNLRRWFASLEDRAPFREHVTSKPLL